MFARTAFPVRAARRRLSRLPAVPLLAILAGSTAATLAPNAAASWERRSTTLRAPNPAGAEATPDAGEVDKFSFPVPPASPRLMLGGLPPHAMACGDVELVLDGFGGFGSASAGGDAFFDAGDGPRATVFEAMAHLRNSGFLDADSLAIPQSEAHSREEGDAVIASYVRGPFRFDLVSRLTGCDEPHAAVLVQEWTITNVSSRAQALGFTLYADGDMFLAGDHRDDYGVAAGEAVWQFDQAAPGRESAYLHLSSTAPAALAIAREVGEYADQRRRINRNQWLTNGLRRGTGVTADADGDGVTDEGFDVSLGISHDFGQVLPGGSVIVEARLAWGVGSIDDIVPSPLAVDLGPDRVLECEGREGTLVEVAAAGEPADAVASWAWRVDGEDVAGDASLAIMLAPGDHEIVLVATDAGGREAEDSVLVTVADTLAPEAIVGADVLLWPPDHRLVDVTLPVELRDACSSSARLVPLSVECNEPAEAGRGGDGHFDVDAMILDGRVLLRRERQGGGADRVYVIRCEAIDDAGNVTPVTVRAVVPHDRSRR